MTRPFEPDYTTPPGVCVLDTCRAKGLTTAELARRMGLPNSYMQMIVHGQCPLTGDVAEGLEQHLGLPRTFWEALENQHQKRKGIIALREHQAARRDALWRGGVLGFTLGVVLLNMIWFGYVRILLLCPSTPTSAGAASGSSADAR